MAKINFKERAISFSNDEYGHSVGDQLLAEFAKTVKSIIRKNDHFCRIGGEEFTVIVPDTDIENTKDFAERVRESVACREFPKAGSITVSIGVAQYRKDDTLDSFIVRADRALYQAKENGRNRVEAA